MNLLTLVTVDVYSFLKPYPHKPYHYQQVENCLNACLLHILSHVLILIDSVVILFPGFLRRKLAQINNDSFNVYHRPFSLHE